MDVKCSSRASCQGCKFQDALIAFTPFSTVNAPRSDHCDGYHAAPTAAGARPRRPPTTTTYDDHLRRGRRRGRQTSKTTARFFPQRQINGLPQKLLAVSPGPTVLFDLALDFLRRTVAVLRGDLVGLELVKTLWFSVQTFSHYHDHKSKVCAA